MCATHMCASEGYSTLLLKGLRYVIFEQAHNKTMSIMSLLCALLCALLCVLLCTFF